jgi:hypothetical protein
MVLLLLERLLLFSYSIYCICDEHVKYSLLRASPV